MKVLLLEPIYSNFHAKLAEHLSDDVFGFIFNLGYIVYLGKCKKIYVHKIIDNYRYDEYALDLVRSNKNLYTQSVEKISHNEPSDSDYRYMAKYFCYLRDFIESNKIDFVIMHNDLRWQHSLAIECCKLINIKYMVTERGLFRPHTTTIDFHGVNAYSSVPKDKLFYKNNEFEGTKYKDYTVPRSTTLKINIYFAIFIILNRIGDLLGLNSSLHNKNYSLTQYVKLFFLQFLKIKKNKTVLPDKFIFVPLQVNTDTQILIHSDFSSMQEFISKVEEDFYSLHSDLKLVFKQHPMEKGLVDYVFDERSFVSDENSDYLITKSEFIITINSTVGFEGLKNYKKVLVLGNAFYKIEGISIPSSLSRLKYDLRRVISGEIDIEHSLIDNFVKYLKCHYQVNGNLFFYDDSMLETVISRVKSQFKSVL